MDKYAERQQCVSEEFKAIANLIGEGVFTDEQSTYSCGAFIQHEVPIAAVAVAIKELASAIKARGGTAYIVCGAARDYYRTGTWDNQDWDVEVHGLAASTLHDILASLGTINEVGKSFAVFKMTFPWGKCDFSLPRKDSKVEPGHTGFVVTTDPFMGLKAAAERRDFTMNALAYEPLSGVMHDFFHGLRDIRNNMLSPTSEVHFLEDPLRVLRGLQFAGRFGLVATPPFYRAARTALAEKHTLSAERVWGEWEKWAKLSTKPVAGINALRTTGWLPVELEYAENIAQDPLWHPEGNVFVHTARALDYVVDHATQDDKMRVVYMFTMLLHDLGKAHTTTISPKGRVISPGHAKVGEEIARKLMTDEFHAPKQICEQVACLVREHMACHGDVTKRAVRRLATRLARHGLTVQHWAFVVEADRMSRGSDKMPDYLVGVIRMARELDCDGGKPKPILMGRHLLERGWSPGPHMGVILDAVYEEQLDGDVTDIASAMAFVNEMS